MSINKIDPFSFTRGIESVIYEEINNEEKLPETSLLSPSDEHIERHLDKIFEIKSINEQILKSLKPDLNDKTIQTPVKYNEMIHSMHNFLENLKDDPLFSDNNNINDIIKKSYELFNEEKSLFDLLNMYRNILHKA